MNQPANQKITPLSGEMMNGIEARRKWVRDHYPQNAEENYKPLDGKLKLLDVILKSGWIKPDETVKLQCLGITLGDALAQKLDLHWVQVEDEYGTDPALRYAETSIIIFPMTLISKRIERGEQVDAYHLFNVMVEGIQKVIADRNVT